MKKYINLPTNKIAMYSFNLLPYINYYNKNKPENEIILIYSSLFKKKKIANTFMHNLILREFEENNIPYTNNKLISTYLSILLKLKLIRPRTKKDAKDDNQFYNENNSLLSYMPQYLNDFDFFNRKKQFCKLTSQELKKGKYILEQNSISANKIVTVHTRDNEYHKELANIWDFRNNDYEDFLEAIDSLNKKDITTFRMGAIQKKLDESFFNEMNINYSEKFRSEFMDIYLISQSKFFVGNTSGLWGIPYLFNVPVVGTDFIPMHHCLMGKNDIWIPKKLWLRKEKRFMKFKEILNIDMRKQVSSKYYYENNIEVVNNSSDEIKSVIQEMNDKIDGKLTYTDKDEELQKRFKLLYNENHIAFNSPSRIGRDFLYNNIDLLD